MPSSPPNTDAILNQVIADKYRVERVLGSGGMGRVYAATQLDVGRSVALKVLHPELAPNPLVVKRFLRESKATARIEHPNTVRLYDFGEDAAGRIFLAMELVEGRTLSDELRATGPLPIDRLVRIGGQIAAGLAAAHAEGVVHRDLKPSNLMLCTRHDLRDHVKVLDFGIAHFADPSDTGDGERLTQTGMVMGTPEFMAPEQVVPGPVDARADLYALGCVLFLLSTGRVPFRGKSAVSTMYAHVTDPAPSPRSLRADLPLWFDALVLQLLEKSPGQRPDSALAVIEALEHGASLPDGAPPSAPVPQPARELRTPGVYVSVGLVVAIIALALTACVLVGALVSGHE